MKKIEVLRWQGRMVAAGVALALASACGSDGDPLDAHPGTISHSGGGPGGGPGGESSATSGEEPTGTTDGMTEGPTTGETTGGLEPTRELCERYLECLAVTQPEALPAAQMGFGAEGTCWDGPPAQIEQCITACYTGIGKSHEAFPDEPKCVQCEQDTDCVTGERCVFGGCHVTYCGDGLVEDNEVCDDADDAWCYGDCTHVANACNPFSHAGCEPGEYCIYPQLGHDTVCGVEPQGPGDGQVCDIDYEELCDAGLTCVHESFIPGCPGEGCCTRLCNFQEPDSCPNGRTCEPYDSNYIGVCLPP